MAQDEPSMTGRICRADDCSNVIPDEMYKALYCNRNCARLQGERDFQNTRVIDCLVCFTLIIDRRPNAITCSEMCNQELQIRRASYKFINDNLQRVYWIQCEASDCDRWRATEFDPERNAGSRRRDRWCSKTCGDRQRARIRRAQDRMEQAAERRDWSFEDLANQSVELVCAGCERLFLGSFRQQAAHLRKQMVFCSSRCRARVHTLYRNNRKRHAIADRDNWLCQHCGKTVRDDVSRSHPDKLHVDHVVPVAYGGSSNWENLQTLCAPCNYDKRNRDMDKQRRIESTVS